jgi:hypothetical protein
MKKENLAHNLGRMPVNDSIFLPLQSQNKKKNWDKI